MKRISKYKIIFTALTVLITIHSISTATNVPKEALNLLQEYIKVSINASKSNLKFKQYFHPDSFFLGGDTFNIAVTPNGNPRVWTIESSSTVYEDHSLEKKGKQELVKVIVKFQAIAIARVTDTLTFKNIKEPFRRTFYLAQLKKQWLILDISDPDLNLISLDKAIISTEDIAKNSNNQAFSQLEKKLKELK
jgi:hypothetical protein